jgi:hypothetical protein
MHSDFQPKVLIYTLLWSLFPENILRQSLIFFKTRPKRNTPNILIQWQCVYYMGIIWEDGIWLHDQNVFFTLLSSFNSHFFYFPQYIMWQMFPQQHASQCNLGCQDTHTNKARLPLALWDSLWLGKASRLALECMVYHGNL